MVSQSLLAGTAIQRVGYALCLFGSEIRKGYRRCRCLGGKNMEIAIELTLPHPLLQPFDARFTHTHLSAATYKASGGKSKMSRI